ncbi:histone acetyltransferase type B catalytic subunit-like [Neltuma alba]|uniref:histone acetyltransferase type B catalytic subunit-like n=1 Tax=Neltuma alba TaxID=207710 RepID=UPI0010A33F4E|nr:histone acetyltransferase type B catalytic subunit-like [Prosopis alba]XP_028785748.1 histone acetyltransferase type B catalytic subunit-like [Prosopis alba]
MGQKKLSTSDPSNETKKKRRVGFSAVDAGVEAKECIKIFLVSSKEEFSTPENFVIDPVDLNSFFDDDGKIYGYEDLKITIWVSSVSFHAYADIKFQSSSDRGKGITDLKSALQRIFAETLVESKDEFLQTFSADKDFIRTTISNAEVLKNKALNGHVTHSNCHAEAAALDSEVVRMVAGSMATGHLYSRLIPLVLLLVDGSSPIDVTDPRWELYLLIQKKSDQQGETQCRLIGFTAVYRFFHYPDGSRLRLSQILVLPPYQHKGYGRSLLEVLNNVAISENVFDFTVEEPLDHFQHVRTCVDTLRLLHFDPIQHTVSSAVSFLKQGKLSKKVHSLRLLPPPNAIEDVRKSLKINKKQFLQCWEVLIYLGLDPAEKHMGDFSSIISSRVKYDILGKDSGTSGKQLIEVPCECDPEMSFVMFRSAANESSTVQMDDNQKNQEEQLQKLVQERLDEIKLIAEKVTLHRVKC